MAGLSGFLRLHAEAAPDDRDLVNRVHALDHRGHHGERGLRFAAHQGQQRQHHASHQDEAQAAGSGQVGRQLAQVLTQHFAVVQDGGLRFPRGHQALQVGQDGGGLGAGLLVLGQQDLQTFAHLRVLGAAQAQLLGGTPANAAIAEDHCPIETILRYITCNSGEFKGEDRHSARQTHHHRMFKAFNINLDQFR